MPNAIVHFEIPAEVDSKQAPLKESIRALERPYRQALAAQGVQKFPENIQKAVAKPAAERTPGEQLLVDQVLTAVSVSAAALDRAMTPEDRANRKQLSDQVAALEKQRPKPVAMADIVTDGDHRFTPEGAGDDVVSCPKCRVTEGIDGSYLHTGSGTYQVPPSHLLVRGDPLSKGPLMQPGFLTVATYGNPPTAIPPADGHTSGRRRALGEWLTSPDNPLTARVMANRIWAHHFGRGIVASLDNFGKMGDRPSHPELLDWLASEFVSRGWSIKQMHRLMMTSDAYQMASAHESAAAADKDPENLSLWRFRTRRLDAEVVRDSIMTVAGTLDLTAGGPPVFPYLPAEILKPVSTGIWKKEEDGPKVWRRSLYVYRKRGLTFPMFQVFDLPDQNFSAAAHRSVSTVPTQALTLLNNEFVLRQARLFAERVAKEAGAGDPARQVDLAYRIALGRPPEAKELAISVDLIKSHALVDLTHVLLNLNEFLYAR